MFLVCGEALYDVFVGPGTEPGGRLALEGVPGGSPFNVAVGLARLGAPTAFLAGVSQDVLGQRLLDRLAAEDVALDYVVRRPERTTLSLVSLHADGAPAYTFYGDGADTSLGGEHLPRIGPEIEGLHFGSYSIAVPPIADALASLARRSRERLVTLDPNVRLGVAPDPSLWRERIAALLPFAGVVKASDEDLRLLWPARDIDGIAADWLARGPRLVVITQGPAGALAYHAGRKLSFAPPAVAVVDTVGAGDAFQAALIDGLLAAGCRSPDAVAGLPRETVHRLVERCIRAGALVCTRRGADPPRRSELN